MPNIIRITPEIDVFKISVDNEINIPTHGNLVDKINAMDLSASNEETARINADNALQANIDAEASTREANDNTLQANIDAEAGLRATADTQLQANIDEEAATRAATDTALQDGIITEVNARIDANIVIHGRIDTEIADRTAGDANLQTQINNLSATVSAGVHWKASVDDLTALQAVYASDLIGDVRLVKSEKDAYIKVAEGTGEYILGLDANGGVGQLSYVRFMDSAEIISGIQNEAVLRSSEDASLSSRINLLNKVAVSSLEFNPASDYSSYLNSTFDEGFGVGYDLTLFINNPGSLAQNVPFDDSISLRIPAGESAFKFVKKPAGSWFHI